MFLPDFILVRVCIVANSSDDDTREVVGQSRRFHFNAKNMTTKILAMALTKVIWELAKQPEYIEPLRAEMHDVFGPEIASSEKSSNGVPQLSHVGRDANILTKFKL
uniref:Uncharacterized protein n=1 Tax=Fusarium oxysporum (strain Fo5176) TaxID=660025 RepID=A0A0D2Y390_FUSOF